MQTGLFLLPEIESMSDGQGPAVDTEPRSCQIVTLEITRSMEHEALDVSIWGSADGEDWGARPLARFPAKSYCGRYSLTLDLAPTPAVKMLRAAWQMHTWTNHELPEPREPLFAFHVEAARGRPSSRATAA